MIQVRRDARRNSSVLAAAAGILVAVGSISLVQAADATFALPPLDDFRAIVERPLFTRDRRPIETGNAKVAPEMPKSETVDPVARYLLAGTATDQADRAVAILHDTSRGVDLKAWVGDQIGGWTIKAINQRTIVLTADAQEVIVTLDAPILPVAPSEGVEPR